MKQEINLTFPGQVGQIGLFDSYEEFEEYIMILQAKDWFYKNHSEKQIKEIEKLNRREK